MPPVQGDSVFKSREVFQCLEDARTPTGALGFSVALHVTLLSLLILVPLLFPQALHLNYRAILLEPPPPLDIQPVELKLPPKISMPKPFRQPEPLEPRIPTPIPLASAPPAPVAPPVPPPSRLAEPRIIEALPKPTPVVPSIPPVLVDSKPSIPTAPQPPVITNVFSGTATPVEKTGSTVSPSTVGGFDQSVGVPGGTGTRKGGTVGLSTVNGFDRSAGVAGGTGTRNGGRGTVGLSAVGGFDPSGAPGGTRSGNGTRAPVASAGFLSSLDVPKTPTNAGKAAQPTQIEKPVEILQKPKPDYTEEARKARIEGEVLLRVLFTSSGESQIVDVVRGLGYGLNENAIRAAKQIRFKPAERDGRPIDSTAIVHIVFQLAY
jgi:TonB family protein